MRWRSSRSSASCRAGLRRLQLDPAVAKASPPRRSPGQDKISGYLKEAIVTGDAKAENGWVFFHSRRVRRQLSRPRDDHVFAWGETHPGRGVSDRRRSGTAEEVQRREQVRGALHTRAKCAPNAFSGRFTMYDKELLLPPKHRSTLHGEPRNKFKTNADGSVDLYHPARFARQGQGAELAARAVRRILLMIAVVLASEKAPSILDGTWKRPR